MAQSIFTMPQLLAAAQAAAPLLLLLAVDPNAPSDGLGVPCRVVGTIPQEPTATVGTPASASVPMDRAIARMLTAIGVPTNLLGYDYLRAALGLLISSPEMGHHLMQNLYPEVARQHGTNARCVERAIRHAIGQTWARGGGGEYGRLLGRISSTVGEKPTNSEFLAQVAECLRMDAYETECNDTSRYLDNRACPVI